MELTVHSSQLPPISIASIEKAYNSLIDNKKGLIRGEIFNSHEEVRNRSKNFFVTSLDYMKGFWIQDIKFVIEGVDSIPRFYFKINAIFDSKYPLTKYLLGELYYLYPRMLGVKNEDGVYNIYKIITFDIYKKEMT